MTSRKIRGFKLNLRIKEVQRRAKKGKLDLSSMNLESEAALSKLLENFLEAAAPSALYYSFSAQGPNLAPVPGLAYSLGLATLGPDLDDFIEQASIQNPAQTPLMGTIAKFALEEATGFILGLVKEEAVEDHCELSPLEYLTEAPSIRDVVSRLEGHKIGVAVSDDGTFRPMHTSAFSVSWMARSKRSAAPKSRA